MRDETDNGNPRSTARIFGHPIHPMLIPFPVAFFIGAFVTDIVYAQTAYLMWQYFSIWLITAGLIMGGLAAVFGHSPSLMKCTLRCAAADVPCGGIGSQALRL